MASESYRPGIWRLRFRAAGVRNAAALALLSLMGCGPAPSEPDGLSGLRPYDRITLAHDGSDGGDATLGGYYAAVLHGFFLQEGLDVTLVQPARPEGSALAMVAAGGADYGVADADRILIARARGQEVVGLLAPVQTGLAELTDAPDPATDFAEETEWDPYGRVLLTGADRIGERPDQVARMARAAARGWRRYIEDPEATHAYMRSKREALDEDRLIADHRALVPRVNNAEARIHGIGTMRAERWADLHRRLKDADQLGPEPGDPESAFNASFVPGPPDEADLLLNFGR